MYQDGSDRALVIDDPAVEPYDWAVAPSLEFLIGGSAGSWLMASPPARATPPRRSRSRDGRARRRSASQPRWPHSSD